VESTTFAGCLPQMFKQISMYTANLYQMLPAYRTFGNPNRKMLSEDSLVTLMSNFELGVATLISPLMRDV
jgi:hypothetical protein